LTRPIQEKKVTSEALRKGAGPLAAQLIAFEPGGYQQNRGEESEKQAKRSAQVRLKLLRRGWCSQSKTSLNSFPSPSRIAIQW
jgi:hypothetical protein